MATLFSSLLETRNEELFEKLYEKGVLNSVFVLLHKMKFHRESVVINLATMQRMLARAESKATIFYIIEDTLDDKIRHTEDYSQEQYFTWSSVKY